MPILPARNVICTFGSWGGGGGGGAVGGCDVSLRHGVVGKFDIFLKTFWIFWKHVGKLYKITCALNSSVSSFCFSQNLYCLYSSREKALSLPKTSIYIFDVSKVKRKIDVSCGQNRYVRLP